MANLANTIPQRFYSLDAVRGFSSLSIVVWHWRYLFFNGTSPGEFESTAQPFYAALFPFYEKGYLAVDLFFCLSGFLFFWLYGERISRREMHAKEFFLLRFSKLYPLHVVTLFVVLFGQLLMLSKTGSFFVYAGNDAYHLALNLFLATDWGLQRWPSYNVPVWSVSIEVLLYALFFVVSRKGVFHWCWLVIGVLAVLALSGQNSDFGRGLFSFFAGGFVYYVYTRLAAEGQCERWSKPLIVVTTTGFVLAVLETKLHFIDPVASQLWRYALASIGYGYDTVISDRVAWLFTTGWLFPVAILTLVVTETSRGALAKRVSRLGDLSYSIYLTHFPLQIFFAYAVAAMGLEKQFFYTEYSMMGFMVLLLGLSMSSYCFLERPARRALRKYSDRYDLRKARRQKV